MSRDPEIVEIRREALEGLLARTETRLDPEDHALVKSLVESLDNVTRLVRERGTTIARLRRLFGLASSEKTADVLGKPGAGGGSDSPGSSGQDAADRAGAAGAPSPGASDTEAAQVLAGTEGPANKAKGHGRVPASDYPDASHIKVAHESLRPGHACPSCDRGTLYPLKEPARILRIVGQAPLVAVCWDCERIRCSACGEVFTAPAPEEAAGEKHTETAASMMALLRYGAGMPLNRLAHLQRDLATPVPASTQWDIARERSDLVRPVFEELCRQAAQGEVVHNDDTYVRILEFMGKRRATLLRNGALPNPERTGLFTTGIVAIAEGRTIALFFTGRKHAGENLTALLDHRDPGLGPPILMCDALDRNRPSGHEVVEGNCGSHARRHFVDQVENFPTECRYLLEMLGKVFKVDELCRTLGLSDEQRLRRHQEDSGPLMADLKAWMQVELDEKRVEPNSGLGEAMNYMLKRWEKFTLFLRVPGAPIHNNIVERALKKAIRHRKNSLFYRTQRGATVGDVYMSLIHTTELDGGNALDYLTELMRHPKAVAENPGAWLPWNYREALARAAAESAA